MRTLENIYKNKLGNSFKILSNTTHEYLALEINQVCFLINSDEIKAFINSTETIIEHHSSCTCPPDLENKMVIYRAKQIEVKMMLSFKQLFLLKDLLKGTEFKLSMNDLLQQYKIV